MITPEISYLNGNMGDVDRYYSAKSGGLADVTASLAAGLLDRGADVHVALPNYEHMFYRKFPLFLKNAIPFIRERMLGKNIQLVEEEAFKHIDSVYCGEGKANVNLSLIFHRTLAHWPSCTIQEVSMIQSGRSPWRQTAETDSFSKTSTPPAFFGPLIAPSNFTGFLIKKNIGSFHES